MCACWECTGLSVYLAGSTAVSGLVKWALPSLLKRLMELPFFVCVLKLAHLDSVVVLGEFSCLFNDPKLQNKILVQHLTNADIKDISSLNCSIIT